MNKTKNNIGLFGSSFDPPHIGHFAVIQHLAESGPFDEIWLLPVYDHPFGKSMLPFKERLELVKLLCKDLNCQKVKICTIEKDQNISPSYTYNTVMALKQTYPDFRFNLILGSDTRRDIDKWYKSKDLLSEVQIYAIPREGYEDSPFPQVSSSEIKERLANKQDISALTLKSIAKRIELKNLYPPLTS